MSVIFDLETGPLSADHLAAFIPPFDAEKEVPHPGEFDPNNVAVGNLKDPAKIAAKVEESRQRHAMEIDNLAASRKRAGDAHFAKHTEKAALSPVLGCVKAIGLWSREDTQSTGAVAWCQGALFSESCGYAETDHDEARIIAAFWKEFANSGEQFVGWNIFGFDLPFLINRSRILNVDVPAGVVTFSGRYANFSSRFVDLMQMWGFGRDMAKLDDVDRAMGGQGKPDDCTGADFARMYDAGGEDRQKAIAYLINDLRMTGRVADAMGVY